MLVVFASMLHERRIIITSKRISNLSACVQGGARTFLILPFGMIQMARRETQKDKNVHFWLQMFSTTLAINNVSQAEGV